MAESQCHNWLTKYFQHFAVILSSHKQLWYMTDWPYFNQSFYPFISQCFSTRHFFSNPVVSTRCYLQMSVCFVLLSFAQDVLSFGSLSILVLQLGPLCFHISNDLHQNSLESEPGPPFLGWPDFTCLVSSRVWISFHISPNIPDCVKNRSRVYLKRLHSSDVNTTIHRFC